MESQKLLERQRPEGPKSEASELRFMKIFASIRKINLFEKRLREFRNFVIGNKEDVQEPELVSPDCLSSFLSVSGEIINQILDNLNEDLKVLQEHLI